MHSHNRLTPNHINVPDNRFDHIHLDLIELPKIGDLRYCLTIIDRFSRWPLAIPLSNMSADSVASAFYTQWVCEFGTPFTITTEQGLQFESALFSSLTRLVRIKRIRTTPYHPQSNGLVERWHRTLKAALMCNSQTPWPELLPTVLLGLRTTYKEDLKASPAKMLFGAPLRIPGEFFVTDSIAADPQVFISKFRQHIQTVKPIQTAHHTKPRLFTLKNLDTCGHVFKRVDSIKKPLEKPYTGPHEVVRRVDDKVFIIKMKGADKAVSIDMPKPAYIDNSDNHQQSDQNLTHANVASKQKVSFQVLPDPVTGRRVDVASQSRQSTPPITDQANLPTPHNQFPSPSTARVRSIGQHFSSCITARKKKE